MTIAPSFAADSTKAIQLHLDRAAGQLAEIPPGKYYLSASLRIASNTKLRAYGAHFAASSSGFALFTNRNFDVPYGTEKIDHDITLEGGTYDYGSFRDGSTHAISMRMASKIVVRDAVFLGGNDATAMLACKGTLVENCHAFGQNNCSYDHWEGPQDATVRNCYAYVLGTANGILFTGVGGEGTQHTASRACFKNNSIHGSHLSPCGPGIVINADGPGCATEHAKVIGNQFMNTGGGIVISGSGGHHELDGNYFIECGSSEKAGADCLIRISPEVNGTSINGPPNGCVIGATTAVGCTVNKVNIGLLQLTGARHTVGALSLRNCHIGGWVFWCPSPGNHIAINGPVTVDAETVRGVMNGLFAGDRTTTITTPNPWRT
ncbi:hypothetical protein [Acidisoma sp. S159]|uniref:hypothetical protein n=1 Tax=Acidisoma sp. S159 TaxID=1747225 RepID=UPI00131CCDC1|nr:hypothetical protein [Acidisoma sp. S159]